MASNLYGTGRAGTTLSASGITPSINWSDGDFNPLTEVSVQRPVTNATVTSGMVARSTFDDTTTGSTTLIVRKNGADDTGGSQLSIPAGTFGPGFTPEAVDTSHTSAIAATDLVNFGGTIATGGTGIKFSFVGMVSTPTSGASIHAYCLTNTSTTGTNNSFYFAPGSTLTSAADTETGTQQLKTRNAGVLQNLTYRIGGNTRTSTSTLGTRVNGTNDPNMLISILSTDNNVQKSDTSHTAALAVGDLWDTYTTGALGVGTLSALVGCVELAATAPCQATPVATASTATTFAAASTTYFLPQAKVAGSTTQAFQQMRVSVAGIASGYQVYTTACGLTADSPLTMQKNGANGNGAVTILASPASTAVWSEDTSHTDAFVWSDEMNWKLAAGATGSTVRVDFLAYLMNNTVSMRQSGTVKGVG